MRAVFLASLIVFALHAEDVPDIVRAYEERSASKQNRTKNYTYQMRSEKRTYDRSGKLKSKDVKTLEYVYQSRGLSVRVIGKNDKPLSPKEAAKEQQGLERRAASARPPSGRSFAEGYRFQLEAVEELNGRPTWVISGQSRTGHVQQRIKLWIDQSDNECARFEGEVDMDFDTRFEHAQANDTFASEMIRVDEGVWLSAHTLLRHDHRLPPFQRFDHEELEITYTNYKRFQTESRIVGDDR